MINIAICDDERTEIEYLTAQVIKWKASRNISAHVSGYESAESFLFSCGNSQTTDVLLLDIQMGKMNGVELAKRIRKDNDISQIVFITGFPDFIGEGYDVSALHYLMKPVSEEKLNEVLDKAVSRLRKSARTITLPKAGGDIRIYADEVLYAEVLSHTVILHLAKRKEEFHLRISDMEAYLGDGFFRCHRSYIVSMMYVRRVTRTAMVLNDGREIPLSRSLYDAANQAFINYN